ncbi:2OG-Fe(II) oxygenase [Saccharibacter sp. 17.LH.SD]|uniref:2OG-Fe(II) oxygenase n=1 Tax=Saccharibacter sp. 17.LH.SD TaxID=2689393 RepID=UPI00136E4360|nr:2OG-Fe(II) oxygenase [Saccharibacter sp. 17.LH.SD]MXV45002.1 2OG-Fe(II) oxygenase [Saccharibacter sp. 17.LH.SD]
MKPIIRLNYDAVRHAPVVNEPCPHLVVPNFISGESLRHILSWRPEIRSGGSYPLEALSLRPELAKMMAEFQGPMLKEIVAEKFDLDIGKAPSMVTMRGQTREKDGRIHRDSASKRVTILLYLNDPAQDWGTHEGCLRFLNGPHDIEDYASEIPPVGGTLVVFPNGPNTWHGHRQYVGPRYTVQLNYMAVGRRTRHELRRHKLSAWWKSLPFVA